MTTVTAALPQLQTLLPEITFEPHHTSYWSPANSTVYYQPSATEPAIWTLLHETSHAILQHTTYDSDFGLLQLEVAAWERAKQLAADLSIRIDEDHIQDCLETYRDWLHQRSTCPRCGIRCFQKDSRHYYCHNCQASWQVSASRFCRAYRMSKLKTPSVAVMQPTGFQ